MEEVVERLKSISSQLIETSKTKLPVIDNIRQIAEKVGRSWSNSWLGYHSTVYYAGLKPPPAGAHFSIEWGLKDNFGLVGSQGNWRIYKTEDVIDHIYNEAGNPDISEDINKSNNSRSLFEKSKTETISLLTASNFTASDPFAENIYEELSKLKLMDEHDYIKYLRPSSQIATRDMAAIEGGLVPPAHIQVEARLFSISSPFIVCGTLADLIDKCTTHLINKISFKQKSRSSGDKIFIGHGNSLLWRELKDFLHDRLNLSCEEFNRIPVAGYTNIARLSQMLDNANFAFLVMTAEDEKKDGTVQARMNVIHEAGLFQGRLGFEKAIILLEEGCEEFSNIHGLGQIRFPLGKISSTFENVREVLERENIVPSST